jgi:hypothetical protein
MTGGLYLTPSTRELVEDRAKVVAVLPASTKASHTLHYQRASYFRLALIKQLKTRMMDASRMVSHRAQFLRYLLFDCRVRSVGIIHSVKLAVE